MKPPTSLCCFGKLSQWNIQQKWGSLEADGGKMEMGFKGTSHPTFQKSPRRQKNLETNVPFWAALAKPRDFAACDHQELIELIQGSEW